MFSIASLLCGLAPNALALIAARVVQGVGGAFMVAQVLSGIQLNFTGRDRTRAIGSYAMALSGAAVVGQILGGVIVTANLFDLSWRPAFLINVPIGLAVLIAGQRCLPRQPQTTVQRLDLRGAAVLSSAVLLVVLPLTLGSEQHWPAWTWVGLAASAAGGRAVCRAWSDASPRAGSSHW